MEEHKKAHSGLWAFLQTKGRIWILLGGALAGILLILLGGSLGTQQDSTKETESKETLSELQAYQATLEEELEKICNEVSGVSHAQVLVTLGSGTRTLYTTDENGKPTTVGSGSSQRALYSTVLPPQVAGVGVVCRGGNDPAIQKKLTDLLSTALGISAGRVSVTGK